MTLANYIFYDKRVSAIVELIEYAYDHARIYDVGMDKLTSLVLDFTTCYIKQLMLTNEFRELLKIEGTLADDLMSRMMRLIV